MPSYQFLVAQAESGGALQMMDRLARTPLSKIVYLVAICTVLRILLYPTLVNTPTHLRSGGYVFAKFFNEFFDAIVYAGVFVFLLIRPFFIQTFFIPTGSMVQTLQVHDFIVINKFAFRAADPQHGDVVVFRPPAYALNLGQPPDTDFIKRCIGVPGDVVEVRDDVLYRNGKKVDEPYIYWTRPESMTHEPTAFYDLSESEKQMSRWRQNWKIVNYKGKWWPVNVSGPGLANVEHVVDEYKLDPVKPEDVETMKALIEAPPAAIPPGKLLFMGDNRLWSSDGRFWGLADRDRVVGKGWFIWMPFSRWRGIH